MPPRPRISKCALLLNAIAAAAGAALPWRFTQADASRSFATATDGVAGQALVAPVAVGHGLYAKTWAEPGDRLEAQLFHRVAPGEEFFRVSLALVAPLNISIARWDELRARGWQLYGSDDLIEEQFGWPFEGPRTQSSDPFGYRLWHPAEERLPRAADPLLVRGDVVGAEAAAVAEAPGWHYWIAVDVEHSTRICQIEGDWFWMARTELSERCSLSVALVVGGAASTWGARELVLQPVFAWPVHVWEGIAVSALVLPPILAAIGLLLAMALAVHRASPCTGPVEGLLVVDVVLGVCAAMYCGTAAQRLSVAAVFISRGLFQPSDIIITVLLLCFTMAMAAVAIGSWVHVRWYQRWTPVHRGVLAGSSVCAVMCAGAGAFAGPAAGLLAAALPLPVHSRMLVVAKVRAVHPEAERPKTPETPNTATSQSLKSAWSLSSPSVLRYAALDSPDVLEPRTLLTRPSPLSAADADASSPDDYPMRDLEPFMMPSLLPPGVKRELLPLPAEMFGRPSSELRRALGIDSGVNQRDPWSVPGLTGDSILGGPPCEKPPFKRLDFLLEDKSSRQASKASQPAGDFATGSPLKGQRSPSKPIGPAPSWANSRHARPLDTTATGAFGNVKADNFEDLANKLDVTVVGGGRAKEALGKAPSLPDSQGQDNADKLDVSGPVLEGLDAQPGQIGDVAVIRSNKSKRGLSLAPALDVEKVLAELEAARFANGMSKDEEPPMPPEARFANGLPISPTVCPPPLDDVPQPPRGFARTPAAANSLRVLGRTEESQPEVPQPPLGQARTPAASAAGNCLKRVDERTQEVDSLLEDLACSKRPGFFRTKTVT